MDELPALLDEEGDVSEAKMASTSSDMSKPMPPRKRQNTDVIKQEGCFFVPYLPFEYNGYLFSMSVNNWLKKFVASICAKLFYCLMGLRMMP